MALDRGKLANVDRRLFAELDRVDDWHLVKVPASAATWSTWKRYCDVVRLSMGRAIAALIDSELAAVVDDELATQSAVIAERVQMLDERAEELDHRDAELQRLKKRLGVHRRPTQAEMERMADQIEPPDPGFGAWSAVLDPSIFKGVGRNDPFRYWSPQAMWRPDSRSADPDAELPRTQVARL